MYQPVLNKHTKLVSPVDAITGNVDNPAQAVAINTTLDELTTFVNNINYTPITEKTKQATTLFLKKNQKFFGDKLPSVYYVKAANYIVLNWCKTKTRW